MRCPVGASERDARPLQLRGPFSVPAPPQSRPRTNYRQGRSLSRALDLGLGQLPLEPCFGSHGPLLVCAFPPGPLGVDLSPGAGATSRGRHSPGTTASVPPCASPGTAAHRPGAPGQ